jgi:hypothetical protein
MSYKDALVSLDAGFSGLTGVQAIDWWETDMGRICAGNYGGIKSVDITSGNYTGIDGDELYETLSIVGTVASNRTVQIYFDAISSKGSKRYYVINDAKSGTSTSYFLTITTGVGGSHSVKLLIRDTGFPAIATVHTVIIDTIGNVYCPDPSNPYEAIYTPTYTGFGSVSVQKNTWKFLGNKIEVFGKFTGATSTGVEARISNPNSWIADSTIYDSISLIGSVIWSTTSDSVVSILIEPNAAFVNLGYQNATGGPFAKSLGSVYGNNITFSYYYKFSISGLNG